MLTTCFPSGNLEFLQMLVEGACMTKAQQKPWALIL